MLDESLFLLQETRATWNVQFELGSDHRLDEARLQQAVLTCCRRHPMARACLAPTPQGETSYRWDFAELADVDPFRVVECLDGAALGRLRAGLYAPPIPLDTSPGFRVALARRPAGISCCCLRATSSLTVSVPCACADHCPGLPGRA